MVRRRGSNYFANNHHARRNPHTDEKLFGRRREAFDVFNELQSRPNCTFRIIFADRRISEICEDAVAMVSSDQTAGYLDDFCCSMLVVSEDVAKALGIKTLAETY